MILVDTSVWINYLKNSDDDTVSIINSYLRRDQVFALSAVFGELLQGVKNKREREIISLLWDGLPKVAENNLFIKAGSLSNAYKFYAHGVGLIDCYILAAALENDLSLWTLDKKLRIATERTTVRLI